MRSPRRTTARPTPATPRLTVAVLEAALIRHVGRERFDLWFAQHTRLQITAEAVIVGVPNLHLQEWLSQRFSREVAAAVREVADRPLPFHFVIDPELFQAARARQEAARPTSTPESVAASIAPTNELIDAPAPAAEERGRRRAARKWRRLEDFVVGPCNRVAFAASQSAIESPGQGPSPLVIHGPVGTGKTHLLEAIYVGLRQSAPEWRVKFTTAEDFTNRFVQAMRNGRIAEFRRQFRDCDALLIDNLQFVGGKQKTQEEFLHTFDALAADGKPIIVTCDCHPKLTDDFVPELADRLTGGVVWGVQPPDKATRLDLLRAKSARHHLAIDETVLAFLADQLRGNVRELEGALNSLRHFSRVTGRPIDVGLAREALGDLLRHTVRAIRLPEIESAVCQVLRLAPGTLQARSRTWSVSHPRMIAIFLARKHTSASYAEVGEYFGGRNHSTAVAAEKKVRAWLSSDGVVAIEDRGWRVREIVGAVERLLGR